MILFSQDYDIRMLEITGVRNVYIPLIYQYIEEWKINHVPWIENIEEAFEWMLEEAVERRFQKHVVNHYPSDLGKHLWGCFPNFMLDIETTLESLRAFEKRQYIEHIKVLVLGNILIVAMLSK